MIIGTMGSSILRREDSDRPGSSRIRELEHAKEPLFPSEIIESCETLYPASPSIKYRTSRVPSAKSSPIKLHLDRSFNWTVLECALWYYCIWRTFAEEFYPGIDWPEVPEQFSSSNPILPLTRTGCSAPRPIARFIYARSAQDLLVSRMWPWLLSGVEDIVIRCWRGGRWKSGGWTCQKNGLLQAHLWDRPNTWHRVIVN